MAAVKAWGVSTEELSGARRWRAFFAMATFATVCMYLQIKVTPVITNLAADLGMAPAQAGLLVSAAALAALAMSLPAAGIMRSLGIKATLVLACSMAVVGSAIGLLGGAHVPSFMASRALEGISLAFGSVVGSAVIPRLFEGKAMGLAMGAWSLWSLPGNIISFISTPLLYGAGGWRAIWVFSLVLEVLALLWMIADFRLPAASEIPQAELAGDAPVRKPHKLSAFVVAACFGLWTIAMGSVVVYYPTYLQEVKGISVLAASVLTMVFPIVAAPFGLWFGVLSERLRARKWFICIPFVAVAALDATIAFSDSPSLAMAVLFLLLFAVCAAAIPMGIYALIPEIARERKTTDYAMGVAGAALQLGNVLVGMFGPLIVALGYHGYALKVVAPLALLAAVATLLCKGERAD